jgi:hypothetical protein
VPAPNAKVNIGIHLALFGLTVAMAVVSKWSTTDLVWSLWISSLTVGYSLILTSIVGTLVHGSAATFVSPKAGALPRPAARGQLQGGCAALPLNVFIAIVCLATVGVTPLGGVVLAVVLASSALAVGGVVRNRPGWEFLPDPERGPVRVLIALPGALFMLGFFTVHFGMFHFVHGLFLSGFFPLVGGAPVGRSGDQVFRTVAGCAREAIVRYWPFVAASALSRVPTYVAAFRTTDGSMMFTPYLNVIRMHVMIFAFAFLGAAGLQSYGLYPLLVVYFLPVGDLLALVRAKRASGGPGAPSEPS